jgi:thiol-disulfide isomerase/thioredoxin
VEFWATWCKPCRKLTPVYRELASKHAAQGLIVVGLSVDREADMQKVRDYVQEHRIEHAIALVPQAVFMAFNPGRDGISVPRALFFDKAGDLVTQINGLSLMGTERKIKKAAEAIIAGH